MLTKSQFDKVNAHFQRECELNERSEVVYKDQNFPVGHIVFAGEYRGWFVDTTGDSDSLAIKLF